MKRPIVSRASSGFAWLVGLCRMARYVGLAEDMAHAALVTGSSDGVRVVACLEAMLLEQSL